MLCSIPKQNYPGAVLTNGMVSYRQQSSWTGEKSGLVLVVNLSCCHSCKCLVPQVTPWCLRVMSLLWRTTPRKPTPLFSFSFQAQKTADSTWQAVGPPSQVHWPFCRSFTCTPVGLNLGPFLRSIPVSHHPWGNSTAL
jgi:hypothetical protein